VTKKAPSNRDYVRSLARGLEVIRAFTRTQPRKTLSDISRTTGMTRATVRRFVHTLVREGYAESDGKYFSLKPKVLELGYAALSSMNFVDVAQPIIVRLAYKLKESVFVAVLEGEDVVYVASSTPPDRFVSISVSVGSRTAAHAVSSGRVLLANLPEEEKLAYLDNAKLTQLTPNTITSKVKLRGELEDARVKGWSIVDQELEIGLRSISVPIRDQAGRVIAALNVACPSSRITPAEMHSKILPELQAASQEITSNLQR
jgi:IclR family pca regulon transcriptional regulator